MAVSTRPGAAGRDRIAIAGIEFIRDASGQILTFDVNTNTNYNSEAEAAAGRSGMRAIADFLGAELAKLQAEPASSLSGRA